MPEISKIKIDDIILGIKDKEVSDILSTLLGEDEEEKSEED